MVTQNILDLLEYCIFDGELTEENFEWKIIDNLPKDFSYDYFHGVSKCVIIPKGAEYVIKIPFTGAEEEDEYWDDELEEYVNEGRRYWDYEYSRFGEGWNYCEAEVILYHKAKSQNIEKILCKPRFIGKVGGHPIYIQERAKCFCFCSNKIYTIDRTSKTTKKCKEKGYIEFNLTWQTDVLEYYGSKTFDKIMKFLNDEYITDDLHDANIGYIGNRPVILDYSGWWD